MLFECMNLHTKAAAASQSSLQGLLSGDRARDQNLRSRAKMLVAIRVAERMKTHSPFSGCSVRIPL